MVDNLDFGSWRCSHDMSLFCLPEGCTKHLGCARDKGWKTGEPTPSEYQWPRAGCAALKARDA